MNKNTIENTLGTSNERDLVGVLQSEGLYRLADYVQGLQDRLKLFKDFEGEELEEIENLKSDLKREEDINDNHINSLELIGSLSDENSLKSLEKSDFLKIFREINEISWPKN